MNKIWQKIGTLTFWITWPGIWLILRSSKRTRVALVAGDKVLVVKPWLGNGKWSLPGGGIRRKEKPAEALIREVEEETGLKLPEKHCHQLSDNTYKQNGLSFGYKLFVCKLKQPKNVKQKSREISETKWISWHELSVRNSNSDVITAIKTL